MIYPNSTSLSRTRVWPLALHHGFPFIGDLPVFCHLEDQARTSVIKDASVFCSLSLLIVCGSSSGGGGGGSRRSGSSGSR